MALEININLTIINDMGVNVIIASMNAPIVKEIKAIRRIIPFLWTSRLSDRMEFLENKIPVMIVVSIANNIKIMGMRVG